MFDFDATVDKVDDIHQGLFGVEIIINGEPSRGIFDESTEEFEGVGDVSRTLEIPLNYLPSTPIINEESTVYMVVDGRTFTVYKTHRIGKNVTLELR